VVCATARPAHKTIVIDAKILLTIRACSSKLISLALGPEEQFATIITIYDNCGRQDASIDVAVALELWLPGDSSPPRS
jgi:hypothetical protein